MKTRQRKGLVIALTFLMIVVLMLYGFALYPRAALAETELASVDQGKYDLYTDADKHGEVNVKEFVKVYSQGVTLYNGSELGEDYDTALVYAEVNGDNPIVNFVPKELFQ